MSLLILFLPQIVYPIFSTAAVGFIRPDDGQTAAIAMGDAKTAAIAMGTIGDREGSEGAVSGGGD